MYNRRAFDLLMKQCIKEVKRDGNEFALLLFDIDHFKSVNDIHGHLAGDKVIQDVVKIAKNAIRDSDMICRWGGEEFLIILRECDWINGKRMAEKIRQKIADHVTMYENEEIRVTISIGVTQYMIDESNDVLIRRVDKALFRAKNGGRNRVEVGDSL